MSHPYEHAETSVRLWGGKREDYTPIHEWLDATKEFFCDIRHRALRHHSQGIFEAQRLFGPIIVNSDGKEVLVRKVCEQHIMEDCGGRVPCVSDYLIHMQTQGWMGRYYEIAPSPQPKREAPPNGLL
jgi:hypothetical protein